MIDMTIVNSWLLYRRNNKSRGDEHLPLNFILKLHSDDATKEIFKHLKDEHSGETETICNDDLAYLIAHYND